MSRKLFAYLALGLMLASPAGLAHANFDGTSRSFPTNAKRVTPFKSGTYELSDGKGNSQKVQITLISQNRYRINGTEGRERNGIAIFYQNTGGSLVLSLYENGKYGYFLATRSGARLTVLDTAYAAHQVLNGKPKDGIPEALEKLPYSNPAQNQAFLKKVWQQGDRGWMRTLFTAKPVK